MIALLKQRSFFEFYLNLLEDPTEWDVEIQEKFQQVFPDILKTCIELIDLVEGLGQKIEENVKLEKLVSGLQDKLIEQDELNKKLSKTFKELSIITEMASHSSEVKQT